VDEEAQCQMLNAKCQMRRHVDYPEAKAQR
jgi:hypothetical protein